MTIHRLTTSIDTYRLSFGQNEQIQIRRIQGDQDYAVAEYPLRVNDVQRDTIKVLIDMLRASRLERNEELKALGANLYTALFSESAGKELMEAVNDKRTDGNPIRIELRFEYEQRELASWPWEYLFCPSDYNVAGSGKFLATMSNRVLLNRSLLLDRIGPIEIDEPPISLLLVAASPKGKEVAYKALRDELRAFEGEQGSAGRLKVHELVGTDLESIASVDNFLTLVDRLSPHVIHFVGHGECTNKGGKIAFVDETGEPEWVKDEDLAEWLNDAPSVRLVFLQACESARPGPHQAISGLALHLAHQAIPAVVGMQYVVENRMASLFARTFYQSLINYAHVDVAMQEGRRSIRMLARRLATKHEFGLPVLYLSRRGGLLIPEVHQPSRPPSSDPQLRRVG
jgi:hypothetical protein